MAKLLVACAKRYNGHELWTLLKVLQDRGHTFEVVSQEHLIRDELTLRPNTVDRTLYEVPSSDAQRFDAFCVVSGNMADTESYWTDPKMEEILRAFKEKDKVLAAICCSVPTLAPIARGIRVSYFPLVRSRQRLANAGAILEQVSLTVDQRTATAENQMITEMWGHEICNLLEDKPQQYIFHPTGFMPKGRPRRLPKEIQDSIDSAREARTKAD
jgi:protease I